MGNSKKTIQNSGSSTQRHTKNLGEIGTWEKVMHFFPFLILFSAETLKKKILSAGCLARTSQLKEIQSVNKAVRVNRIL